MTIYRCVLLQNIHSGKTIIKGVSKKKKLLTLVSCFFFGKHISGCYDQLKSFLASLNLLNKDLLNYEFLVK